ncbi:MAG: sugar phosphate isomerase/epimerase [Angelakisella sp.]|nr:sugar phosphate isomerase/epimerase [Angelakisella sp.]
MGRQSGENREWSLKNLRALASEGKERGLALVVGTCGKQTGSFVWDLPTLAAYIKDTDRENILATVTLPELAEAGLDIPGCVELFGGKLGHVYLADRGGKIPGSTGEEMEGYLRALEAANFSGFVSVQISFQDCILTPDRWLLESARWLRKKKFL